MYKISEINTEEILNEKNFTYNDDDFEELKVAPGYSITRSSDKPFMVRNDKTRNYVCFP
jgi:uncharacterized protein YlzI (FlbEa/FlbD family)